MYNQKEIWSKMTFRLFYKCFTVEVIISVLGIVGLIFGIVQYGDFSSKGNPLTFLLLFGFLILWIWRLKAVGALFYRFRPSDETKQAE